MPTKRYHRSREASLWQSAADEVISKSNAGHALDVGVPVPVERADPDAPEMSAVNNIAQAVEQGAAIPIPGGPVDARTLGVSDVAKFCASAAFQLARARVKKILTGDGTDLTKFQEVLGTQFGTCDPRWAEIIAQFVKNSVANNVIPYRRYAQLSDYVIEGAVGNRARVALVADWGTGDQAAKLLLRQVAQKQPDVVIHLGDIYYSGTDHEFQNYLYGIWQNMFGLPVVAWGAKPAAPTHPATFALSGNHDMYAGGQPYYTTIDMLGQPASYFCLRNQDWQFIAMDTGLHDNLPTTSSITFLEDSEVAWIKDKIQTAGGRKTVLLSHHQLFSAFENIGAAGNRINQRLHSQLEDVLPDVTVWYWGHEHDLVVYPKFMNVLARCIGHGAVPVAFDEIGSADPAVPFQPVRLAVDTDGGLFQHGYAIMELDGPAATATHYQFDPVSQDETVIYTENFPA